MVLSMFKMVRWQSTLIIDVVALAQTSTSLGGICHGTSSCTTAKYTKYLLSDWLIVFDIYGYILSYKGALIKVIISNNSIHYIILNSDQKK